MIRSATRIGLTFLLCFQFAQIAASQNRNEKTAPTRKRTTFVDSCSEQNSEVNPGSILKSADISHLRRSNVRSTILSVPEHGADEYVKSIGSIRHLKTLNVSKSDFGRLCLPLNEMFPTLRELFGEDCEVDSKIMSNLDGLPLTTLDLSKTKLSPGSMPSLACHSQLKKLNLSETNVSDEAMSAIGKLDQLEELNLSYTNITATGLKHLKNLSRLKSLNLSHISLSGIEPDTFSRMGALSSLDLSGTDMTDDDFRSVINSKASVLNLSNTLITNKSIEELGSRTNLRRVELHDVTSNEGNDYISRSTANPKVFWGSSREYAIQNQRNDPFRNHLQDPLRNYENNLYVEGVGYEWTRVLANYPENTRLYTGGSKRFQARCGNAKWAEEATFAEDQFIIGAAKISLNRHAEAIKNFTRYLDVYHGSATAHSNRGLAYMLSGDHSRAQVDFDRAIYWNKDEASAYAFRSELMRRLGNFECAKKDQEIAERLAYKPFFKLSF